MHAVIWIWETTLLSSSGYTWQIRDYFFLFGCVRAAVYLFFSLTPVTAITVPAPNPENKWMHRGGMGPSSLFCSLLQMESQRAAAQTLSHGMVRKTCLGGRRRDRGEGRERWSTEERREEKHRTLWLISINQGDTGRYTLGTFASLLLPAKLSCSY